MNLLQEYDKVTLRGRVLESVRSAQRICNSALDLTYHKMEVRSLSILKILASRTTEDHTKLIASIDIVLAKYGERGIHDSTLMDELHTMLPEYVDIPLNSFWQYRIVYLATGFVAKCELEEARKLLTDKRDIAVIDQLKRIVHNMFIGNPNFNGKHPYYERNWHMYSEKLTKELINRDFDSYITYLDGALEEDEHKQGPETLQAEALISK